MASFQLKVRNQKSATEKQQSKVGSQQPAGGFAPGISLRGLEPPLVDMNQWKFGILFFLWRPLSISRVPWPWRPAFQWFFTASIPVRFDFG